MIGQGCGPGCHGWCVLDGRPCHAAGVVCVVCGLDFRADWDGRDAVMERLAS